MYKFRYRSIENKDFKKVYYNGFAGVICKSCGNPIVFKSKYEIMGTKDADNKAKPYMPSIRNMCRTYFIRCKNCSEQNMYVNGEIYNPNVVHPVAVLNSKGYTCQGVGGNSRFEVTDFNPRIWFKDLKYMEIFRKYPLPSDWVVEKYEYARGNLVIGFKNDKKVPTKEFDKRMEILDQWIKSLPVNI